MPNTLEIPSQFPGQAQQQSPNTLEIPQRLHLHQVQAPWAVPQMVHQGGSGRGGPSFEDLTRAIVMQESGGNPNARGKAGEIGLMQIMPETARQYGVDPKTLTDPQVNLALGRRILRSYWNRYKGNFNMVLTAYNAGPGAADKGRVPASTQNYISSVWRRLGNSISGGFEGTAYADELPASIKGARKVTTTPWGSSAGAGRPAGGGPGGPPMPRAIAGARKVGDPPWASTGDSSPGVLGRIGRWLGPDQSGHDVTGRVRQWALAHAREMDKADEQNHPGLARALNQWGINNENIMRHITPETNTEAAIDAAMLGTGLGEFGWMTRLGAPAAAGAAGAYSRGDSPVWGGVQGGGSATIGELIGMGTGIIGRSLGGEKLAQDTTEDIAGSIVNGPNPDVKVPGLGQRIGINDAPETSAELEKTFGRRSGAVKKASAVADKISDEGTAALGKQKLVSPHILNLTKDATGVGHSVTLDEAENIIEGLNEGTYNPSGTPKAVKGRGAMRRDADRLRTEIENQLNALDPKAALGTKWRNARKDQAATMKIRQLIVDSFDPETHQIDQAKMEHLLRTKYYDDLERLMKPGEAEHLLLKVRRDPGGKLGPAGDKPGEPLHGRIGMSLEPHFGIPRSPKPVGDVPAYMNKARTNPMRIPGGLLANDFFGFWNNPLGDNQ